MGRLAAQRPGLGLPRREQTAGREAVAAVPLRRQGGPEEIAAAVAFLLSEYACYVTVAGGETIAAG
jgi:NAD(P)-dependent dehydrogenase (short-subunit alcohol dehydrogenase family)